MHSRSLATKAAERELGDFLKNEIEAEKQLARKQMGAAQAPTMAGFEIKTNEADVTLTKTHGSEKITIRFNVNQTVEPDMHDAMGEETQGQQQEEHETRMTARPDFEVEIAKGGVKLCFSCAYMEQRTDEDAMPTEGELGHDDLFAIHEVFVSTGESHDHVYSSTGDMMDGNLYEHLMDYLAERGIDEKFAQDLIKFSTHYEHAQYVALLQKIRDFVAK